MRLSFNVISWCVAFALFSSAAFFTWNVVAFKNKLNVSGGAVSVKTGESVRVEKIIDGDEISVSRNGAQFIVRILGIVAYEATGNDELVQDTARQSIFYLERNLLGKDVVLEFEKLEFDPRSVCWPISASTERTWARRW